MKTLDLKKPRDLGQILSDTFLYIRIYYKSLLKPFLVYVLPPLLLTVLFLGGGFGSLFSASFQNPQMLESDISTLVGPGLSIAFGIVAVLVTTWMLLSVIHQHLRFAAKGDIPSNLGEFSKGMFSKSIIIILTYMGIGAVSYTHLLMKRTAKRPLPDKRISAASGMFFSLILIFSGLFYLFFMVNPVAGAVSFATTFIYLIAYTPMKQVSAFNILIGAIPGALPPVGGWAAATGHLADPGMWLLFGIVFLWQVPHVMAIAWSLKEDYSGAGFKMIPKNDETGFKTSVWSLICTVLLFPVSIAMFMMGISGIIFLVLSLLLAGIFLFYSIKFFQERSRCV